MLGTNTLGKTTLVCCCYFSKGFPSEVMIRWELNPLALECAVRGKRDQVVLVLWIWQVTRFDWNLPVCTGGVVTLKMLNQGGEAWIFQTN